MTTFDQVLPLARELPQPDQARLRATLVEAEETARAEQIAHNQAAIAKEEPSWLKTFLN